MPGANYANLSVEAVRKNRLARLFESSKITVKSFSLWAMDRLETSLQRELYLKKKYPHYTIIENYENRFIIEDSKSNKIVKVEWKDGSMLCNDKDPNYIIFASLHPEFRLA